MTTTAKLLTALPKNHGLDPRLVDGHYNELVNKTRPEPVVALIVLEPHKHAGDVDGDNEVSYKVLHVEPDADMTKQHLARIEELRADRLGFLPLDFETRPDEEQRLELIEAIDKWSERTGVTGADVDERWRSHFGIGEGAAEGLAGTYEKGSTVQLLEFARTIGAVTDPESDSDTAEDDDTGGET